MRKLLRCGHSRVPRDFSYELWINICGKPCSSATCAYAGAGTKPRCCSGRPPELLGSVRPDSPEDHPRGCITGPDQTGRVADHNAALPLLQQALRERTCKSMAKATGWTQYTMNPRSARFPIALGQPRGHRHPRARARPRHAKRPRQQPDAADHRRTSARGEMAIGASTGPRRTGEPRDRGLNLPADNVRAAACPNAASAIAHIDPARKRSLTRLRRTQCSPALPADHPWVLDLKARIATGAGETGRPLSLEGRSRPSPDPRRRQPVPAAAGFPPAFRRDATAAAAMPSASQLARLSTSHRRWRRGHRMHTSAARWLACRRAVQPTSFGIRPTCLKRADVAAPPRRSGAPEGPDSDQ